MPIVAKQRVHFGPFELDVHAGELFKHGLKLKLQGHPIQILALLLERPGELITREEIQQKLWPSESETFVDFEHGLNTAVRKLRQALGDEVETPQYIETLPRRGYRFVGKIAEENGEQSTASEGSRTVVPAPVKVPERDTRQWRNASWRSPVALLSLLLLASIAMVVARYAWTAQTRLLVTGTRQLTFNNVVLGLVTGTTGQYGSIQTDGRRVYYTVIHENALRYVSVNGGEENKLPSPVENPVILHISPDGSTLIVRAVVGAKGRTEGPLWLVEANGGSACKLGDIEGQDAAFAPDGKTIAVVIGRAIYLTDASGATPVKLAEVPGSAFWLRWSPDGSRLRFSIIKPPTAEQEIWEVDRSGGVKQVLKGWTRQGKVQTEICCGIWTRDGNYFLFRSAGQYWAVREGSRFGRPEPSLLTTSGMNLRAATASPLANTIYVSGILDALHGVKLDTRTKQTSLAYPDLQPESIEHSVDGVRIAYLRATAAAKELWTARVDGSDRRLITSAPLTVYMARISPDGKKIVLMAKSGSEPWRIYWVSTDGGELHEVPSPVKNHADPNWSPDGKSILFGQPPETWRDPGVPRHLYVYDTESGKTSEINGSDGLFAPRLSPDGRYVAAMRIDFQGMSLLDRTTGKWRVLTQQSTDEPFWSPDSAWVYFNSFR